MNRFTFAICLSALCVTIFAQSENTSLKLRREKTDLVKKADPTVLGTACVYDSSYIYRFDTLSSAWKLDRKMLLTRDANNNYIDQTYYSWTGGSWINALKISQTYDANSNLLTSMFQNWGGTNWNNMMGETYTYTPFNAWSERLDLNGSGTNWLLNEYQTSTFDPNNNRADILGFSWNGGSWDTLGKILFTYDPNNNLIIEDYSTWNTGTWMNSYTSYFTYNGANDQIEWVRITPFTMNRYASTFDANHNKLSDTAQSWNSGTNSWDNNSLHTWTYDANQNLIDNKIQLWNPQTLSWYNYWWNSHTYDAFDNELSYMVQDWDTLSATWIPNYKETAAYCGNTCWDNRVFFDWKNNSWLRTDSITYFCGLAVGIAQQNNSENILNVHPNPSSGMLKIENSGDNISYSVHTLLGEKVLQGKLVRGENTIDLTHLAPAIYFIQGGRNKPVKLVINR